MKRVVLALLAFVLLSLGRAHAGADDVLLRARPDPADGVVIGQPVRILVEVLFKDSMPRPPRVDLPDVPGAQVMRFETQGVTIRDQVGAQAYIGQRFEFVLFPRRGGTFVVPGARVTLLDPQGDETGALQGQNLRLSVRIPEGVDPSKPVLAAGSVTAGQAWDPDPQSARLKPGGAVIRSITRKAAGVPAMAMSNFTFGAPAGVRVYVDPPRIEDKVSRGDVEGVRIDKVTYVFEKPGSYDLQALEQPWWDLEGAEMRNETLDGARFVVAGAPAASSGRGSGEEPWLRPLLVGSVLVAAVFLPAWLARRRIAAAYRQARERYVNSETFAWRALRRTAQTGQASATYRAVKVWRGRLSLQALQRLQNDGEVNALLRRLDGILFGNGAAWSRELGTELAGRLGRLRSAGWQRVRPRPDALPPLNPPSLDEG